jgi:hypothetical protein
MVIPRTAHRRSMVEPFETDGVQGHVNVHFVHPSRARSDVRTCVRGIVDLVGSIKQVAEIVRARVESKKYIRNFADKAVG